MIENKNNNIKSIYSYFNKLWSYPNKNIIVNYYDDYFNDNYYRLTGIWTGLEIIIHENHIQIQQIGDLNAEYEMNILQNELLYLLKSYCIENDIILKSSSEGTLSNINSIYREYLINNL